MKARRHGTPEAVTQATRRLAEVLEVVAVSDPSPDRGTSGLVRAYLEVRLPPTPATSAATRPPPPMRRPRP